MIGNDWLRTAFKSAASAVQSLRTIQRATNDNASAIVDAAVKRVLAPLRWLLLHA